MSRFVFSKTAEKNSSGTVIETYYMESQPYGLSIRIGYFYDLERMYDDFTLFMEKEQQEHSPQVTVKEVVMPDGCICYDCIVKFGTKESVKRYDDIQSANEAALRIRERHRMVQDIFRKVRKNNKGDTQP